MPVDGVTAASSTPPASLISSSSAAMGKADFLQMLTAQLKAQDPLNPLSNQDFATQLAQFSSLQELQTMNTELGQALQSNLLLTQTFNNTMAASFIGKIARANSNTIEMGTAGNASLTYKLGANATNVTIDIKDSSGHIVRTLNPAAQASGEQSVAWDGLGANGQRVAAGTYTFSVNATDSNGKTVDVTTFIEGLVTEVRFANGGALLVVGDREIQLGDVMSLRDPTSGTGG
jgi:flagellar basal-body rod modification protein FlgD